MKFEIVDDIYKSNRENLSKLNRTVATTIEGGRGRIYRGKVINNERARDLLLEKINKYNEEN